jgi:hypothetical protein
VLDRYLTAGALPDDDPLLLCSIRVIKREHLTKLQLNIANRRCTCNSIGSARVSMITKMRSNIPKSTKLLRTNRSNKSNLCTSCCSARHLRWHNILIRQLHGFCNRSDCTNGPICRHSVARLRPSVQNEQRQALNCSVVAENDAANHCMTVTNHTYEAAMLSSRQATLLTMPMGKHTDTADTALRL